MNKNKRLVQNKLVNKQDVIKGIPAVLGNNEYVVNVPEKPGYVYARIDEHVFEVFNDQVAAIPGIPVLIGYDQIEKNQYKILSIRHSRNQISQHQSDPHHETHEWMNKNGGTDVVFVHQRQILPLRVTPAGGLTIWVHRAVILAGGELREIAPGDVVDLSSYLPIGEDEGRFVLVSIDESGDVAVTAGTAKTVSSLALSDVPERTSGHRMIAAIRLYTGQTQIKESRLINDLVDLRWAQSGESSSDLEEIRNVDISDLSDGDALVFDEISGKWINKSIILTGLSIDLNVTKETVVVDTLLGEITLTANGSFTFSDISQDYDHLKLVGSVRSTVTGDSDFMFLQMNGDSTTSHYVRQRHSIEAGNHHGARADDSGAGYITGASKPSTARSQWICEIFNYRESNYKTAHMRSYAYYHYQDFTDVMWESTAAINALHFYIPGGLFSSGSNMKLYGSKEIEVVTNVEIVSE